MQDFVIKFLFLLVSLLVFYGACAMIQFTVLRPKTRYVVIGFFAAAAVLIGLLGLLAFAAPNVFSDPAAAVEPVQQSRRIGTLYLVLAGATLLPLLKPVRLLLARFTPFDPNSTVDISGLVLLLWIFVLAGTALFTVNLAEVAQQANITVADSLIGVLAYPALALSLVGIFITRGWRESVKRLGLERPTARQVAIALALVFPLLAVVLASDRAGRALQPELYRQLEGVLRAMSSNVTNPLVAVVLAFSAGIGEEILLRGAVQPRYGIALTSITFALLHTQYGVSYAVVGVLLIGIVLGYERKYLNTTACIITHGAYNTIAFLLPYLAG